MTLSDAIRMANRRGFASADFNLTDHARYEAMPQFIRDVQFVIGSPFWAQKKAWFHFVPGRESYDLPLDFGRMLEIRPMWDNRCCEPMQYVGENPGKVLAADFRQPGVQYTGWQCHPYYSGGYFVEHTQNRWVFGPIGAADYGYVYSAKPEWPPVPPAVVAMGTAPIVFATYSSGGLEPYKYSTGFLRFDTATLPTEATVTGVTLNLYIDGSILNMDNKVLLIEWYNQWPIDGDDYAMVPIDGAWLGTVSKLSPGVNSIELLDFTQINRYGFSGMRLQLAAAKPEGSNEIRINVKRGGPFSPEFSPEFDKEIIATGTSLEIRYTVPIVYPFQLRLTGPVESEFDAEGLYNWVVPPGPVDTELDQYLPPDIQGLFIAKLRCDILKDAFGQGDARYQSEKEEYVEALETLLPHSEAAMKRKVVHVR